MRVQMQKCMHAHENSVFQEELNFIIEFVVFAIVYDVYRRLNVVTLIFSFASRMKPLRSIRLVYIFEIIAIVTIQFLA